MKRSLIILTLLGGSLLLASTARAEYSFSISYGYPSVPRHSNACTYNPGRGIACGPSRRVVRLPDPRHYSRRGRNNTTRIVYVNTTSPRTVVTPEIRVVSQEKLGISDVVVLSKAGVNDTAIIEKIARTGSVFDLSVEEVVALRREGVSSRVINYMLDTAR